MKKITLLFLILFTVPTYSQWIFQNSGVDRSLKDVCCVTEDFVVVVGDEGYILKTTDGGNSWMQKNSGSSSSLIKVQFVNQDIGYALGNYGALLKTIDGGENWTTIISDQVETFTTGMTCINENVIYISENYELKKSVDGGITFQTIFSSIGRIQFINEQLGYALGYESLLKTIDGGNTWTPILSSDYIFDFYFFDENNGFINNSNGLLKTADGGLTYNYLDSFDTNINKLYATTQNIVWGLPIACLLNFSPCYSIKAEISNSGNYQRTNGNLLYVNSLSFANPTKGYAVGEYGVIFKNNTGMDNLALNEVNKKNEVSIYPNPTSENVTVSLSESNESPYEIEISDNLGKIIFSQLYHAESSVTISTCAFSKGIYFLSITKDDERKTQKLIVD